MRERGLRDNDSLDTNGILDLALEFLGEEYKEVREGVYVSFKNNAVVRISDYDLSGHRGKVPPHVNFETLAGKKGPKYHLLYRD